MTDTPFQTLERLRANYPTPLSSAQNAALLNDTAWTHRADHWGVYSKPGGTNCQRSDGAFISRDILCQLGSPTGVDCLRDAEGAAEPVWTTGVVIDATKWLHPIAPSTEVPVPPQPIPPTVPTPQPPVTSYSQWVNVEIHLLVAAYIDAHDGNYPAASDLAHLGYRRLVERWTIADMVKDI